MKKKIAIALSGGVDSLVTAFLLKQTPHELFGIHFTTGYETRPVDMDAVARQLGIVVHTVDLSTRFSHRVVDYFTDTYLSGKTPNPCLICNRTIKFDALRAAAQTYGATHLATGHYARIQPDQYGNAALYKGLDPIKEQSYFLGLLTGEQLSGIIFPLGNMTKPQVVAIARKNGLAPPVKKESQDICFIKEAAFSDFIDAHTDNAHFLPGPIVTTTGTTVGTHRGLHRYTIGQRRGLNCPGPAPYYVKHIDMKNNQLVVGFKADLLEKSLQVQETNWLLPTPLESPLTVETRIRYNHPGAPSQLIPAPGGIQVNFEQPQHAVTPGQGAVFYLNDRVIGAGIIQ